MKFSKRDFRIILTCSVLPAVVMIYVTSVLFSSKYESNASIYVSKPSNVFVPKSMSNAEGEFSAVTVDNLELLVADKEIQKKIGLKLLATHLTLPHAEPDVISNKHFNALHQSAPSEILSLKGETDSITYLNLASIANEHPFLIETIQQSDNPFYSNTAISAISVQKVGASDMIAVSYLSDDQGTSKQTLEIFLDICRQHFDQQNKTKINKIITYCEQQFQNAKNELMLSGEKLQKPSNNARIRTAQQREQMLKQLNAERSKKMATRERILNQLIVEKERVSLSENSIKTILFPFQQ